MKFSLTILGSSSALPTSDRFLTAQVLNVNERFFLIDCGEGTQIQLRKCKIPFGRIKHIFISHLHGDHVFGLPGLLSTFNLLGRTEELHIYSHKSLKQILNQFLGQFYTTLGFNLIYHALEEDGFSLIYEDKSLEVFSFPLRHRIPCWGFLFKEKERMKNIKKEMISMYNIPVREIVNIKKGADFINEEGECIPNYRLTIPPPKPKSFAFVTDTEFLPGIVDHFKNVDLLYHEATFLNEDEELARQTHIRKFLLCLTKEKLIIFISG
ncbi:MAG TPA: ribonuclease Z [Bacteroidales bacterium]|nr:ribonuclease Z [Bacteroidales bacterium]